MCDKKKSDENEKVVSSKD